MKKNDKTELEQQVGELTIDLQRTRADFENYRKQADLQKLQYADIIKVATVNKVLPLLDDIALAITAHPELEPLKKTLDKTLADLSLARIPTDPGTSFDPELHEAISVEGEGETETIAETLRPGYTYEGSLLRPALVKVEKK